MPAIGYKGFAYTILPALVLAIEIAPFLIRTLTVSVAGVMGQNFIDILYVGSVVTSGLGCCKSPQWGCCHSRSPACCQCLAIAVRSSVHRGRQAGAAARRGRDPFRR
ncbi:hypothetical protein [Paracoccus mutanolyticus]|uniref:hypothetical protein n=1 Tax=Paracoccus mutanolyticus TaxID=1499308 RepID=UPI001CB8D660|nr:hypothetical protein [Paracoccus mutanolyticus]